MAQRKSIHAPGTSEMPSRPAAVISTLTAVTLPTPKRVMSRLEARLDTTVPAETTIEMYPASDSGAPSSACMTGHALPSTESGSPRLMNAM